MTERAAQAEPGFLAGFIQAGVVQIFAPLILLAALLPMSAYGDTPHPMRAFSFLMMWLGITQFLYITPFWRLRRLGRSVQYETGIALTVALILAGNIIACILLIVDPRMFQ